MQTKKYKIRRTTRICAVQRVIIENTKQRTKVKANPTIGDIALIRDAMCNS